jgi:Ca2+-transporting ATPase
MPFMTPETQKTDQEDPGIRINWHSLGQQETLEKLETPVTTGLQPEEAVKRLEKFGLNQLAEGKKTSFFHLVLEQLSSFVIILLIVAAVLSAVLGDLVEAGVILAIVILNAVMGVVQETRAEQSLAALKKMAAPEAMVQRGGKRFNIPSRELVPGDIVFLEAGNYIPADLRLIEAINLKVDEAALTGESQAVVKNAEVILDEDASLGDRRNSAFMGTVVAYGRGKGVVVHTGMHTQLGMIATMLQSVGNEQTPLQKKLDDLGKMLGYGALVVCALVFVFGFIRSDGDPQAIIDSFMVAVSLAVAAVPEGLPAVVTISLALGMQEMVRRHALIRKLSSVETLGSATVICTDKTGTLTQNQMTATRLWVDGTFIDITGTGYSPEGDFKIDGRKIDLSDYPAALTALWVGALNNDAQLEESGDSEGVTTYRMIGDPTEGSLTVAALKAGAAYTQLNKDYPRTAEVPFDSIRKRMITIHAIENPKAEDCSPVYDEGKSTCYAVTVKGAPDELIDLCSRYQLMNDREAKPFTPEEKQKVKDAIDAMTKNALRVLGLAFQIVPFNPEGKTAEQLEQDLIFAGLIGMIDPPRAEVKPALEKARTAGIRTIMITGDYPNTARAIAESITLLQPGHKVMVGSELDTLDDAQMRETVRNTDVFARVSPEHKMRIVEALRANDEVTAMTGDGVNDAPAIKLADIGVSMGITGTDVAKETADMVLTDDNYASIVSAVEQGRIIYSNIRKFVYYLLSCNVAEIGIIFLPTALGHSSPLTAIQLLWLNLITDGAPALALSTEKGDPDIMMQKPRPAKESIINNFMKLGIVIQTIAIMGATLAAYYIGSFTDPKHIEFAETMAFVTLSCSELLRAYTARSEYYSLFKIGMFKNKFMNLAVLASLILIMAVVYLPFLNGVFNTKPLGLAQWEVMIPLLLVPSIAAELTKAFFSPMRKAKKA